MLLNMRVSTQCVLLALVGLADLCSTVVLVQSGAAYEANPIMRALIPYGWLVFALVKASTLAAFVSLITWYRQRNPRLGSLIETCTLVGYITLYASVFSVINL